MSPAKSAHRALSYVKLALAALLCLGTGIGIGIGVGIVWKWPFQKPAAAGEAYDHVDAIHVVMLGSSRQHTQAAQRVLRDPVQRCAPPRRIYKPGTTRFHGEAERQAVCSDTCDKVGRRSWVWSCAAADQSPAGAGQRLRRGQAQSWAA
jgi:hypothetical protein